MSKILKVAVVDTLTGEFEKRWREDLSGLPIEFELVRDSSKDALNKAVAGANILITRNCPVDEVLLDRAGEALQLVVKLSRWRIGIDEQACADRNVTIANVIQMGCITVAEHAMTLLLMCARDMITSHLGVVNGEYRKYSLVPKVTSERSFAFKWLPVTPFEVYGKTIGIVGFGEIGKELATRANAFGMRIIYYDVQRAPAKVEQELAAEFRELNSLMSEADFISLHVPHTRANDKLIGTPQFKRMRKTAFLINACRGGVVDEEALVNALKKQEIAGAGLDVFVKEPLPYDHSLTKLNNVVLSPHIGGGTGTGRAEQKRIVHKLIGEVLETSK